jgi:S-adenosylmethionine-diacylglycerol 3-amino-3-carboxypropyl transferase
LQAHFPNLEIVVVDPNTAQLDLLRRKIAALQTASATERRALFNIGDTNPQGLNACGNFESLFRSLRRFLEDLVWPADAWARAFDNPEEMRRLPAEVFAHPYWRIAFELHFGEPLLETMFGQAAIQHAPPASYPRYFQNVFERGLTASHSSRNYFLHHMLLGAYRDRADCLPDYLVRPVPTYRLTLAQTTAQEVEGLESFDLVSLSNIFDWMSEAEIDSVARRCTEKMQPGAGLVFRQLNHQKDFRKHFGTRFAFDNAMGDRLRAADRSLFYSRINIAFASGG